MRHCPPGAPFADASRVGESMTFRLVVLTLVVVAGTAAAEERAGFQPIFDGSTLVDWDGDPKFWRVEAGAITAESTPDNPVDKNTFLIWRGGELDDFELMLEYRIVGRRANSGVLYRSWEDPGAWGQWVVGGYQADIEAGDKHSGTVHGERYGGVLAQRGEQTVIGPDRKPKVVGAHGDPQALQALIKKEDWNEYHIRASGYDLVHTINGHVMSETRDDDATRRRRSGLLALQLHSGPSMKVQFRNIRLKRLKLQDRKKIVFLAGKRSHGYFAHEHNAGCLLLAKALNESPLPVLAAVYRNGRPDSPVGVQEDGWPSDPTAFDNADAIVLFMDGGGRNHVANGHLKEIDRFMKRGVGLACIHYGVEVEKGAAGDAFLDWIGGYFEMYWSVNPHWTLRPSRAVLAQDHSITRGVRPFEINDEWYYHMRFRKDRTGLTPILRGVPPAATRERRHASHSGNSHVEARRGMYETVAWSYERPDGGRGFGFTGAHNHANWGHDDFRKLVLNALAWISHAEVPPDGVPSAPLTREALEANQDYPKPAGR